MPESKRQQVERLLGQILVKQGSVTQADIDRALKLQKQAMRNAKPLASLLVELGLLTETDALRALSEQLGVPGIDLTQVAVLLVDLDLVPREVAVARRVLPVLVRDDRLFLAMANPKDKRASEELEFVTGRKIFAYVASQSTLERTVAAVYDARARGETYYLGPNVPKSTLAHLAVDRAPHPQKDEPPKQDQRTTVRPKQVEALGPGGYAVVLDDAVRRAGERGQVSSPDLEEVDGRISDPASGTELSTVPATDSEPEPELADGDGSIVLVVDDEEDIRALLGSLLRAKGHRVIEADRGLAALRAIKTYSPDVVILDAMLPELHGFDIARRIRQSEKYRNTPIIMISGVYKGARVADDLRANYGIQEYLEKPFALADVTAAVERALARSPENEAPTRLPEEAMTDANVFLQQGVEAYKIGDVEGAIDALKKGIVLAPNAYRLRYQLALLYGKRGQIYDGITELERAVELHPKHFPALKNLAILYEKAGFKNKAIETWERCVHLAPEMETRVSIKEHLTTLT